MYFTVTIDTEEDNWGEYDRPSYSVENVRRIPRLQEVFDRYGVRPTYLITYPVATNATAIEILGGYRDAGRCEIGTHPHPWNTPPLTEARIPFNSFISNLPPALQFEKIQTLTDTIERNFGSRPTSYRSGRWGFNDDIARHLIRLGYAIDTSVYPTCSWRPLGGPDFTGRSHDAFTFQADGKNGGSLLEVPATIDFVQQPRHVAARISRVVKGLPAGEKFAAALSKLGVLQHLFLSPEINTAAGMIRLASTLRARGARVVNMFFHSPTLLEGCSPFTRTPAQVAAFMACIESFLAFAQAAGLTPAMMSELTPAAVGASSTAHLRAT